MCGIAGIMTRTGAPPEKEILESMMDALAHRGPDDDGIYISGDTGMVHTRLAIIDLQTGDQPLYEPGGCALVANGEIYNFLELRESLAGTELFTHSDCEPPLFLYRKRGLDFAEALRGMYAIAIHDPGEDRLVLARDPFGIKPLYYVESALGFAFASEPSAFFAAGILEPTVRSRAAEELLQLQFTTGAETIFRNVYRVLPGETIVVRNGRVSSRRRRQAFPRSKPAAWNETEAMDRLEHALFDSVGQHQRSDVPYGMFLSGGIDSSTILAVMARLNDRPVRAFTVGFPGTGVADEREQARAIADSLGAEHIEIAFEERDFWSYLPPVVDSLDDPTADYAALPTYKLAETAGHDLKVILSGEGGDELFGGYGRYRSYMRPKWQFGKEMRAKGFLSGFGILREEDGYWRRGIEIAEARERMNQQTRLQRAQTVDCADWLPNDLLTKLDRCLMAHGVEGRTPFLDPVVASIAMRLPDRLKVRGRTGKWLLRKWLAKYAPASQPFTPKRGFTVPVGEWIAAKGDLLGAEIAREPGIQEFCDPAAVERLFRTSARQHGLAAWTLLFFALWHDRHVTRDYRLDDLFQTLGTA